MDNSVNADMKEFWNGPGGERWVQFQDRMDESLLPFGHRAMAAAAISPGERVIDVGCGCGDASVEMARLAGRDGQVLGVDISELVLVRARERGRSVAEGNLAFECLDAQTHLFEGAVADVVFSRFGVMFFDDPVAAFGNFYQALKPGGRLAFVCWQPIKDNEWARRSLDVVGNHLELPPPSAPEEPGPFSFGDAKKITRVLGDAGFADVLIEDFEAPLVVGENLDEAVAFFSRFGPAGSVMMKSDADEATKSRIMEDMRSTFAPHLTGDGVIMDSATWIVTAKKT